MEFSSRASSDVLDLLTSANSALSLCPPDELTAIALLRKAADTAPNDPECLSALAELLCTAEDPGVRSELEALKFFEKSLQIDSVTKPERYFYLGQLLASQEGRAKDAETSYKEGIRLLEAEAALVERNGDTDECAAIKRQISKAYCAIAELYMTDLCDEQDAEAQVINLLKAAVHVDSESFDAYVGLTTYSKTIGDLEKALDSGERALAILRHCKMQAESGDLPFLNPQGSKNVALTEFPSWNSRLSLAAALIDLKQSTEAYEVLESLMEENDGDIQVWHLMACNHLVCENVSEAEECVEVGKWLVARVNEGAEVSEKNSKLHQEFISLWTNVLMMTTQQISKLKIQTSAT